MKSMKSKLLALGLSLLMLVSCLPLTAGAQTFYDVPSGAWYYDYVEEAAAAGYVNGVGSGQYKPNKTVSNAEFCTMVTRMFFGNPDAQTGPWWLPFCQTAYQKQLLAQTDFGNSYDTLGAWYTDLANAPMNRSEMVRIMANCVVVSGLWDYLLSEGIDLSDHYFYEDAQNYFSDMDSLPPRYAEALSVCYALGLINGKGDGLFDGEASMTRAQAAKVLMGMSDFAPDPEGPLPTPGPVDPKPQPSNPFSPEAVYQKLMSYQGKYPEGRYWTNEISYKTNAYYPTYTSYTGYGCVAFAFILSDGVFGDLPIVEKHSDFDRIRPGDTLRVNYDRHTVIVLKVLPDSVIVAEGNYNSSIHWGREMSRYELEQENFYAETRYPK